MLLSILVLWFAVTGVMIALYARYELIGTWREPVLRRPVVIIESDDWGAGPACQADVLKKIISILTDVSDCDGRCPVMTLGMVLASPDGEKIEVSGSYHRKVISMLTHGAMLDAINSGVGAGVFTIQLHGMEHYWPPALIAASRSNEDVRAWLKQTAGAFTEDLPSPLQSRWVDASFLPSRQLTSEDINHAVQEEVAAFQAVFGVRPKVVVPPTFIWNEVVEQAWAEAGVEIIITPGRRIEARDEAGRPADAGKPIYNGQSGENGIVYLVRDTYFEPSVGHKAGQALAECVSRTRVRRPVLFETHRFNFIGMKAKQAQAFGELERLLRDVVKTFPDLAFISTTKLASLLKNRNPEWVEQGLRRRLHVWIDRLGEFHRLRKLVVLSGWIAPVWLVWKLTQ